MIETMIGQSMGHGGAPSGAIFDLDGTVADTLFDITAALNTALAAANRPPARVEDVRRWVGDGLPTLCARAWPHCNAAQGAELVRATREAYRAHTLDRTTLYPGIRSLLGDLHGRGVPLAILSNKPHDLTLRAVVGLGVRRFFRVVRGCVTEEDRKPSPRVAVEIARSWNVPPAQVYLVGDSEIDVATARAAGMISVAVTWGFRDRAELVAAGAQFIFEHPVDVGELPGLRDADADRK